MLHDAVDWGRVAVATVARGVVATLLGLALWAAAPAVIGWQPTTVVTGSMEPRLTPGDVVVSRPVAPGEIRPGRILLADDPDQSGHLRMHRYVEEGSGGTLVTKGDANPQQDSTPLERSDVHGVAFLRIPFVGAPILWLRQGEWTKVVVLALGLTALLALCAVDGSLRRLVAADAADDDADAPDHGDDSHGPGDGPSAGGDAGREARAGAATGLPSDAATVVTRRSLRAHQRRVQRLRRFGGATAVLVIAGSVGLLVPAQAVAVPWSATTVDPVSSFGATTVPQATGLTCTSNGDGTVNIGFAYAGPAATSFSVVNGSTVLATGTTGATSPVKVTGTAILGLGQVYTVSVRVNFAGTWTSTSTATTRIQTALVTTNLSCAT